MLKEVPDTTMSEVRLFFIIRSSRVLSPMSISSKELLCLSKKGSGKIDQRDFKGRLSHSLGKKIYGAAVSNDGRADVRVTL